MFADDTNISFSGRNLSELENRMNHELTKLNTWLEVSKLSLNIAKTELMVVGSRQRQSTFDNHDLCVVVNNEPIKKVKSTSVTPDENLTWENHIIS